ncbi:MIZU-KUSSEI 1 protein [Nymphaea thermarum]|nr:MIZU-KUSSEI 1 protein [Nymphaea thermarum]
MTPEFARLKRNGSSRKVTPANQNPTATTMDPIPDEPICSPFTRLPTSQHLKPPQKPATASRPFFPLLPIIKSFLSSRKWLNHSSSSSGSSSSALGKRVTGTLFGHRKGNVNFVVQDSPCSTPALMLELAIPTSSLVKEMASGLVRLALECERGAGKSPLFGEPFWTMYCNGRKSGYSVSRQCGEGDQKVLGLLRAVSVGAGVLPVAAAHDGDAAGGGELMYMRAKFERVVGSCDSEAFYMINPDGNGGPELSIFLIRL